MKKIVLLSLLLASPVMAAENPPEPTQHPNWAQVRRETEQKLRENLADPDAARIEWTHGFSWNYTKGAMLLPKKWGWIGCYRINAKNRMGAYNGYQDGVSIVRPDGRVSIDYTTNTNQCDSFGPNTPLQPELIDMPANAAATGGSMADELGKLAALRDRGIITPAEFDAQKARLLAR